jgi:phosphoribosyl 1,2-cyclic phosphodiesterase
MQALFHQDLVVVSLGSGSRGNATYVGDGQTGVLIDCGLSTRQIHARMAAVGLADAPIDAVLITHEHTDHCASAAVFERRASASGQQIPFYMTVGTAQGMNASVRPNTIRPIVPGSAFTVGGLRIEPIGVPHDTHDPVCFTVASGATRVGVITDLGTFTRLIVRQLATLDVAVLEFNHDVDMLLDGPHPWPVKQRVRGAHGHLSNAQAADLLEQAARDTRRLRHVVLAHLSRDNNTPELALDACASALHRAGRRNVRFEAAPQDAPIDPIRVGGPVAFDAPRPEGVRAEAPAHDNVIPLFPAAARR